MTDMDVPAKREEIIQDVEEKVTEGEPRLRARPAHAR